MKPSKNAKIRLRNLVDDWNYGAIIIYLSTKISIFLYRLLSFENKDGWRKTTEVHHRNDEAKYIGSLHNLAINDKDSANVKDARKIIINKLFDVFKDEPDLHYALKWKTHACIRVPHDIMDLMEVIYNPSGKINELKFYPDQVKASAFLLNDNSVHVLLDRIKVAYNETYLVQDKKRSLLLFRKLNKYLDKNGGKYPKAELSKIINRMLSATWINFNEESGQGDHRMAPYFFTNQKNAGFGLLNIHCRYSVSGWLDIWMQFSHIGIDGRAASKLQRKIYNAFGTFDPDLDFPKDFMFRENGYTFKYPDRNVFHGCSFVDFGPLLQLKEKLTEKTGSVLPVSILIWALAKHQLFKGVKFNMPVDIPAQDSKERTVGFVFVKPEKYFTGNGEEKSFQEFNSSINEQIKGIRKRQNENYFFLQTAVMTPDAILASLPLYMSSGLYAFTGHTCVTFMENIEYAIPSLSDNINSIIAISLMQKNDNTMACVSVRTRSDIAKEMLSAVAEVTKHINEFVKIDIP